MENNSNLIGRRIHEARLSAKPKLTQIRLASKLQIEGVDITQSQISKIESGVRSVSDTELVAIAKLLQVSASWLLGETDHPQRLK